MNIASDCVEEFKDFERFDKALRSAQTSDKEIDETARTETMAMTRWLRSRRSLKFWTPLPHSKKKNDRYLYPYLGVL